MLIENTTFLMVYSVIYLGFKMWIIAILILFLILSAFFSSAETALMTLPEHKVKMLLKRKEKFSDKLAKIKENPKKLIITILIGNNIVNIGASAIATKIAIDLFGNIGAGIATGVMTFIILLFGEIAPKTYATIYSEKISLIYAWPIHILMIILHPLTIMFESFTTIILKIAKKNHEIDDDLTEEEIISLLRLGSEKRVIDKNERELMESILELDDTMISEVMTKKDKIFMINQETPIYEAIEEINKNPHSRIPIFDEYTMKISGFIHIKDLLTNIHLQNLKLEELKRDIMFVRDYEKVGDVFEDLQENGLHIAAVRNSANKLVGIVTMEDLIEEIFGEIYDETDITPTSPHVINKNIAIVHARTKIGKVNWLFKNKIPKSYNNMTVFEYISRNIHSFEPNQYTIINGLKFRIENVVKGKPRLIKIIKQRKKNRKTL